MSQAVTQQPKLDRSGYFRMLQVLFTMVVDADVGQILGASSMPLLLGSWWGLIPGLMIAVATIWRTSRRIKYCDKSFPITRNTYSRHATACCPAFGNLIP
jgi:hypothetical protein